MGDLHSQARNAPERSLKIKRKRKRKIKGGTIPSVGGKTQDKENLDMLVLWGWGHFETLWT